MMLPPIPLYYTSFLILAPALYGQGHVIGMLYTIMLGLSVLNHAKKHEAYPGKRLIEALDKLVAHVLALKLVFYAVTLRHIPEARTPLALFWWCLAYVAYNYHYKRRRVLKQNAHDLQDQLVRLHMKFHAAAVFGGMCVIYAARHA